ncbi:MAG TPA: hypothetical protein VEK73_13360 [Xanthobacteraceae bacterium]|nr:hypothetical protein [Xanthobacteraceae bacterium]
MPKQPEDLVIRILRDIQATLARHTKTLADHTERFQHIEERFDDLEPRIIAALGLGTDAHLRDKGMSKDINDLKKRVKRLEAKL